MSAEWVIFSDKCSLHRSAPQRWLSRKTTTFGVLGASSKVLLCSEWWVGIWTVGVWPRSAVGWWPSDSLCLFKRPVVKKKAAAANASGDARHLAAVESEHFKDMLSLVEHCAIVRYDDGDSRQPGWFTVKTLGAAWLVQVKDPDGACSFQFVSDTLDKALEGAALLLSCDQAPWQPDPFLAREKGKGKK